MMADLGLEFLDWHSNEFEARLTTILRFVFDPDTLRPERERMRQREHDRAAHALRCPRAGRVRDSRAATERSADAISRAAEERAPLSADGRETLAAR
jgi:hypothetical protein